MLYHGVQYIMLCTSGGVMAAEFFPNKELVARVWNVGFTHI